MTVKDGATDVSDQNLISSDKYCCIVKQTGDGNKENHLLGDNYCFDETLNSYN